MAKGDEKNALGDTLPELARRVKFKNSQSDSPKSNLESSEGWTQDADLQSHMRSHSSDSVAALMDENDPGRTLSFREPGIGQKALCGASASWDDLTARRVVSKQPVNKDVFNRGADSKQMFSEKQGPRKDSAKRSEQTPAAPGWRMFKTVLKDLKSKTQFTVRRIYKRVPKSTPPSEYHSEGTENIPKESSAGMTTLQGGETENPSSKDTGSHGSEDTENDTTEVMETDKRRFLRYEGTEKSTLKDSESDERRRSHGLEEDSGTSKRKVPRHEETEKCTPGYTKSSTRRGSHGHEEDSVTGERKFHRYEGTEKATPGDTETSKRRGSRGLEENSVTGDRKFHRYEGTEKATPGDTETSKRRGAHGLEENLVTGERRFQRYEGTEKATPVDTETSKRRGSHGLQENSVTGESRFHRYEGTKNSTPKDKVTSKRRVSHGLEEGSVTGESRSHRYEGTEKSTLKDIATSKRRGSHGLEAVSVTSKRRGSHGLEESVTGERRFHRVEGNQNSTPKNLEIGKRRGSHGLKDGTVNGESRFHRFEGTEESTPKHSGTRKRRVSHGLEEDSVTGESRSPRFERTEECTAEDTGAKKRSSSYRLDEGLVTRESGSHRYERTANSIHKDSSTSKRRSQGHEESKELIPDNSGTVENRFRGYKPEGNGNFIPKESETGKRRMSHGLEEGEIPVWEDWDTYPYTRRRSLKSLVFLVGDDGEQLPNKSLPLDSPEEESSGETQGSVHGDFPPLRSDSMARYPDAASKDWMYAHEEADQEGVARADPKTSGKWELDQQGGLGELQGRVCRDFPPLRSDSLARTPDTASRYWMYAPMKADPEGVARADLKTSGKRKLGQSRLSDVGMKRLKQEGGTYANVVSLPRVLKAENFNCDYYEHFYSAAEAGELFDECEESLHYLEGELATIKLYGRTIPLPRRQVAFGDDGLTYTYSRMTVPAKPWTPFLAEVRRKIEDTTAYRFNFVLINRYEDRYCSIQDHHDDEGDLCPRHISYKDGYDSIGEHRDDEKDLDPEHPIASLSLGQPRDFMFRHMDARGKYKKRDMDNIQLQLKHGSLFMMNYPTNQYWFHSLPKRPNQSGVRINMTFRKILRNDGSDR